MSKFKVGDKVRVVKGEYLYKNGVVDVVTQVESVCGMELLHFEGALKGHKRIFAWRFELVEEPKPTPPEPSSTSFKVGDKVRIVKDGHWMTYHFKKKEFYIVSGVGVDRVSAVDDDEDDLWWAPCHFELVEEEAKPVPQLPGIPHGFRAVRVGFRAVRVGAPVKGEWYVSDEGASVSNGLQFSKSYTILEKIDQPAPVEPPKPVEPVKPAKKVAPTFKVGDKVRLKDNTSREQFPNGTVDTVVSINRNGINSEMDLLVFDGPLGRCGGLFSRRFELVEEVKPVVPVGPKFKKGDKYKCVTEGIQDCTQGKVYEVIEDHSLDFIFKDDEGDIRQRRFYSHYREFEFVTESPDDLVFQTLVPSREGIDFGWWVAPEKFDTFVPTQNTKWGMNGYYAGKMHGWTTDGGGSLLAVMCYRKDLPVLPTTRTIVLNEYICWDNATPEACLVFWQTEATCGHESFASFDNERPTGNTRTVEVPIVKP